MHIDTLLTQYIGEFGRYQLLMTLLVGIEDIFTCAQTLVAVFIASEESNHCRLPATGDDCNGKHCTPLRNCSYDNLKSIFLPRIEDGSYSKCFINNIDLNITYSCDDNIGTLYSMRNLTVDLDWMFNSTEVIACSEWEFDHSIFQRTVVEEWSLVCDRKWMIGTVSSTFFAGRIIGNVFGGMVADRFGRRRIILVCAVMSMLLAGASALSTSLAMFATIRVFCALFVTTMSNTTFILCSELAGPKRRTFAGMIVLTYFPVGGLFLTLCAYLVRHWRYLILAITVPQVLYIIAVFILMPESPRWDLSKGQEKRAVVTLNKMSRFNKRETPPKYDLQKQNQAKTYHAVHLLNYKGVCIVTVALCFVWFVVGFQYYALTMTMGSFGGDIFLSFFISFLLEIPPTYSIAPTFGRFGRIKCMVMSNSLVAVLMLVIMGVPNTESYSWLRMVIGVAGRTIASYTFGSTWVYSAEVFPTNVRSIGCATTSMMGRVASIISSYFFLLHDIHFSIPYTLLVVTSSSAAALLWFMPETKGQNMPQTFHEAERMIRRCSRMFRHPKETIEASGELKAVGEDGNRN